ESDQQLFQRVEVRGLIPAHAFQCLNNLGTLHHSPCQRSCKRRQCMGAVTKHFNQPATQTKNQHRTKLRIGRAAEYQLIAKTRHHRLNRDGLECSTRSKAFTNLVESFADSSGIAQLEMNATAIGLVRDRLRVQLYYNGIAN